MQWHFWLIAALTAIIHLSIRWIIRVRSRPNPHALPTLDLVEYSDGTSSTIIVTNDPLEYVTIRRVTYTTNTMSHVVTGNIINTFLPPISTHTSSSGIYFKP